MKTFLIQIEKFDTAISIREKIRWAKADRVLLIWPKRGKAVFSDPEIELFKRETQNIGADVAFVCHDPKLKELAEVNGISVYESVPQAESSSWKKARQKEGKTDSFSRKSPTHFEPRIKESAKDRTGWISRSVSIIIAGLAGIALLVFFIPSATLVIYPQLAEKTIEIAIWASPDIETINMNGNMPAVIQTTQLSKTATAQSTGKTDLPSKYATGQVVFTNVSGQSVEIPMGTVLMKSDDDGIKFVTIQGTSVDPSAESEAVKIQAVQAGSNGNLEAGMITSIDGQLGGMLTVTNLEATTGGEDVSAPSPTEEDYQRLTQEIIDELRKEALSQFQGTDRVLLADTVDEGTVVSEIRSVDVGSAADTFSLTLTVEFKGLSYSNTDLLSLANQAMLAGLDAEETIYGSGVAITETEPARGSITDGAKWTVSVSAATGRKVDTPQIVQQITGKTTTEAMDLINAMLPLRQEVEINSFPSHWKWIPWLSLNTQIEVR
jgi:hypothetical protein